MTLVSAKIARLPEQAALVANHMLNSGWVTPLDCFNDLGVTRLAARIFDIRAGGIKVIDEWYAGINRSGEPVRYKRYRLGE